MSPPACANVVVCPRKSQNGPEWFEVEPYATFERRLSTYLGTQPKSRQRASSCEIEDARACGPAGQEVSVVADNMAVTRNTEAAALANIACALLVAGALLRQSVFPSDRDQGESLMDDALERVSLVLSHIEGRDPFSR
jgi:hypothetical protein